MSHFKAKMPNSFPGIGVCPFVR